VHLKCTSRRWEEVVNIAADINFTDEEDALIWQFQSSGVYSSQSLYGVINFKGVIPVYIPAVWKLLVSPRVHFFLWLMSHNKLLTRDNLAKRIKIDDPSCLFCGEDESIDHVFFECVVARQAWGLVSEVIGFSIGSNYESFAKCWLCNKRFGVVNMFTVALCWGGGAETKK
jgi:hypothetical protein